MAVCFPRKNLSYLILILHLNNCLSFFQKITQVSLPPVTTSAPVTLPDDIPLIPQSSRSWIPKEFFTAPRFCNNYTHNYVIDNQDICRGKNVLLVTGVRSATMGYDSRNVIRQTWGSLKEYKGLSVITLFLLGRDNRPSVQEAIRQEDKINHDIIQADFVDTYQNLTIKSQMIFKWMRDYCPHAQYFMITDLDLFVDIYKLTNYLAGIQSKADDCYVLCKVEWTEKPFRPPQYGGHSAMPKNEYPTDHYAPYCWGGANVATVSVINKLYIASLHTPRLRIDDVWIGILAEKAGITFPPTSEAYILPWHDTHHLLNHEKYFDGPIMFASWHGRQVSRKIHNMWNKVRSNFQNKGQGLKKNQSVFINNKIK